MSHIGTGGKTGRKLRWTAAGCAGFDVSVRVWHRGCGKLKGEVAKIGTGRTFAVILVKRAKAASSDAAPVSALRHVPAQLQCQHRLAQSRNAQEASRSSWTHFS